VVDGTLVRGFDYYTDTLWEVTASGLGAQNAIGGGGRYDNLVETLGGKPTPGVGFGSGLERLLIALEAQGVSIPDNRKPLFWLVSQNDAAREANMALLSELRASNIPADMDLIGRKMDKQFKMADREKAAWCIIVGETELASGTVKLKNFKTQEQTSVARIEIVKHLQSLISA
jgi:histidyl-tRNA synthetase